MGLAKVKIEKLLTPEEYLAFERESEIRHEYLDGKVFAMAGESLSHSRICVNLAGELRAKLKGKPCEPLSPNMKVRTSTASLFSYPDVTVVCGEPIFHDLKKDVLINPLVIIEVLSPSTANYDRTRKFQRYRMGNETLTDYVLVTQEFAFVEHYVKQNDGNWVYASYGDVNLEVSIDSIGCILSLREIYDRVELNEPPEEHFED
jgi:Uma2 family endonuclease